MNGVTDLSRIRNTAGDMGLFVVKKELQSYFHRFVDPVRCMFSCDKARLDINGAGASFDDTVIGLEGFARILWGLVPYWIGGGDQCYMAKEYCKGICAGTDPGSAGYWGKCSDNDQRFVEMAPIAFGLLAAPQFLWEPLPEYARDNLVSWLSQINHHEIPLCNWIYFRILVNLALKMCGREYSKDLLKRDMELVDSWYIGDGWYVDGNSGRIDYYVPFAMYFYSILIAFFTGVGLDAVKSRARKFFSSYSLFFDGRGAAVPYGRSLTYRFAQSSFFSAYALIEDDERVLAEIKWHILSNLSYWQDSGMFNGDGSLSVGYWFPNLTMAENYNSPCSPYWCLKTFLCLMLPDEHKFWAITANAGKGDYVFKKLDKPGFLISSDWWNVVLYPPGSKLRKDLGHFDAKYGKFAYSSAFAFSIPHSNNNLQDAAPDSMLAFEFPDGRIAVRKQSISVEISENHMVSVWSPDEGIVVTSEIYPMQNGQRRVHRIFTNRDVYAYDCGFSFPGYGFKSQVSEKSITIFNDTLSFKTSCLQADGSPLVIKSSPNTNILFKNSSIPAIRYEVDRNHSLVVETLFTYNLLCQDKQCFEEMRFKKN